MDFKLLGSILLIVGSSIGAGMLALPIVTAELGFIGSIILLFVCWAVVTTAAFILLEVNLWMPMNSNINTMARSTIGPLGQIVSWISYLILLYALLCAYIGGGSDLFRHLLERWGVNLPASVASILFTILFGSIVYMGIRSVDYVNRGLMLLKFTALFLLVVLLLPLASSAKLTAGNMHELTSSAAITVTITSFGFATIVPSLRIYLVGDLPKLKKAILLGSLIPLVCYIIWDAAIMGVIPMGGEHGLARILNSNNSTSDLTKALSITAGDPSITFFTQLFTSICVLTSFLGVALCLTDFWADGLQLEKKGKNHLIIVAATFLPPLIVVLFIPGLFVTALQYAGIDIVVLLILLPALMAWIGRYHKKIHRGFTVPGGKVLLVMMMLFSVAMIVNEFIH
jgi:tyrosine-specific transport protein